MIASPMNVLTQHGIRKTKAQKEAFRRDVTDFFRRYGYEPTVEKAKNGAHNVVVGSPETAKFLITAHYDTPARMFLPNLITPCSLPLFILWQIVMVAVLVGIAAVPGVVVGLLVGEFAPGFLTGYVCYMGVLFLMLFGPANRHNANDNTSGVVTVLEIAKSMPENLRSRVCFVLFDLEEAGLLGSAAYAKAHRAAIQNQIVLNLDCVGDGDEIIFVPTKKLRQKLATSGCVGEAPAGCLLKVAGRFGEKQISLRMNGFCYYPSDQRRFPYGVGIAALHRGRLALYLGRIHTDRDRILEHTNVNLLRAAIITVVGSAAE